MLRFIILNMILLIFTSIAVFCKDTPNVIYTYTLNDNGTQRSYDETIAVACFQGILNREKPVLWINAQREKHADVWREIMSEDGRWLSGKSWKTIESLDDLRIFAGDKIKGAVIWDPTVPATVNVGNTIVMGYKSKFSRHLSRLN